MDNSLWWWIGFNAALLAMLALDLGVFHRKAHVVSVKEALTWSAVWVALALGFWTLVSRWHGAEAGLEFLTGYVVEKSLAVDNIFVMVMIFAYFRVPAIYQHKILFWGILGALVMRAVFIFAGVALIERFHWMIYVFGGLLVFTGVKLFFAGHREINPELNPIMRLFRRFVPVTKDYHGGHFLVKDAGRWVATPMLVALVFVEISDLIFAVDSIPAILAISRDPFIVFTSNALAILGLRSMYFAIGGLMQMFHYLNYGLSAILLFVGGKMLLIDFFKVPTATSLGVIAAILATSVLASIARPRVLESLPTTPSREGT